MQETSKLPRGSEESRGETPKPHESSVVSAADADVPDHPLEEPRALSEAGQRYRLAKQLRECTGRSAIQCSRALEVHGDDLERAAAWLHTQGTPDAISLLREQTGSSQVLCQIALDRCQGDMGRAAEWLEKRIDSARLARWRQTAIEMGYRADEGELLQPPRAKPPQWVLEMAQEWASRSNSTSSSLIESRGCYG